MAVSAAQHAMASQPLQVGGEVFSLANGSTPMLGDPLPQMQAFDLPNGAPDPSL